MNKNVAHYASKVGFDAGEYTWFDLTDLPKDYEDEFNEYSRSIGWDVANFALDEIPMPADDVAIIFNHDGEKPQFIITYSKQITFDDEVYKVSYEGPAICAYYSEYPDPTPAAIICNRKNRFTNTFLHVRSDLQKTFERGDFKKMCEGLEQIMMTKPVKTLALLNRKAEVNNTMLTAYRGEEKSSFINKKRRAKNKPPIYEWVTIELKPSAPRKEHQGGTHASPARHQRRGHFRKLRTGKVSWVKPTWVGNIERGLIVHDYVTGATQ
jgi:hypothetical protein